MTTNTHTHRAIPSQQQTRTFRGCLALAASHCVPGAHGGVTNLDYCRCSAYRESNSNAYARTEYGRWIES